MSNFKVQMVTKQEPLILGFKPLDFI
jgi:hypothetical protein